MKKILQYMVAVLLLVSVTGVRAGSLDPTTGPAPTMHTLEEIYQKLVDVEARLVMAGIGDPPLVTIEMVTVGDAGNLDDAGGSGDGAVAYEYRIGKYEVTNAEYVEFLNAVDPNGGNALGLWNTSMSNNGGISNNVSAGTGAKFVVKPGFANKPAVYVSFYEAMRFCNWLHNGAQPGADTEDGAYTLLGGTATPSNGATVERNPRAKFAVPTEDEWYKAAYYDPVNEGADAGGNADYWFYPTMSDTAPTPTGPTSDPNSANYNGAVGNVTDIGAYTGSPSHYGTFDQGGNVWEWNETLFGSSRILRGGSWGSISIQSDLWNASGPAFGSIDFGFRISSP